jgi:hypothetical protein
LVFDLAEQQLLPEVVVARDVPVAADVERLENLAVHICRLDAFRLVDADRVLGTHIHGNEQRIATGDTRRPCAYLIIAIRVREGGRVGETVARFAEEPA